MNKYLLLFLLTLLATPLFAQQKEDLVAITGIKPAYAKGEPIRFNVTNTTNQDLYVSFGLSTYLEGGDEWFEQVPDLSNYNCDLRKKYGVVSSVLMAKDTATIEWKPKKADKKHCFNWQRNGGKYIVFINVAESIESEAIKTATSIFTIN